MLVNASNHTKYVLLSNQRCDVQPTLINLHPNEYNQEFHHYPNAINDLSNKLCVPNRTEDLNLHDYRNK